MTTAASRTVPWRAPAPPPAGVAGDPARPARRAAVALALLAAALPSQEMPKDRTALVQALASASAREVAWAAHFARQQDDKALAAPLHEALARWRADGTPEGRNVCLHLLDALLGIATPVPSDVAVPLLDDPTCGVAAFALLARAPQHNEATLLATFRRDLAEVAPNSPTQARLLATGNLLAAQRTPGFAALIVGRVECDVRIRVRDASPRRSGNAVVFANWRQPAAGWPALPAYRFAASRHPVMGNWQPVDLPKPIEGAVLREGPPAAGDGLGMARSRPYPPPRPLELVWLCTLAGEHAPPHVLEHGFEQPERFVAFATTARDERRALLQRVRAKLVGDGVLTEQQARPLDGAVGVEVLDERTTAGADLPHVPPVR